MLIHLLTFTVVPKELLRMATVKKLKDPGHTFNFTFLEFPCTFFSFNRRGILNYFFVCLLHRLP